MQYGNKLLHYFIYDSVFLCIYSKFEPQESQVLFEMLFILPQYWHSFVCNESSSFFSSIIMSCNVVTEFMLLEIEIRLNPQVAIRLKIIIKTNGITTPIILKLSVLKVLKLITIKATKEIKSPIAPMISNGLPIFASFVFNCFALPPN